MAIDRWLLAQHSAGLHPPTLRFYTWSPVAISLGYHQRQWPEFWQQLQWQGERVELVRRPTGGRAVLHQGDLTYAVVTSGLSGTRSQTYQRICEFLIAGWRSLGVELHYGHAGRGYIHNPNCFGTATGADLVLSDGTKLIGSAQVLRHRGILQHGSMQLATNPQLFEQIFGHLPGTVTLPVSLEPTELMSQIIEALVWAAKSCFGIEFVTQPLREEEWAQILAIEPLSVP